MHCGHRHGSSTSPAPADVLDYHLDQRQFVIPGDFLKVPVTRDIAAIAHPLSSDFFLWTVMLH